MSPYIFVLFFISGACGLIYQVVWTRMVTHVFGTTVLAVSTVLAAFMAGLALGSYVLGKRSHTAANPLRRYALYEFGIGGANLVVLFLLGHITPLSVWMTDQLGASPYLFAALRFAIVFFLILVPTTLMGATLPILSQLVLTRPDRVGRGLGSLYATNTVGAVFGCLLAGFFLIGKIGIHNSIFLAAALNLGVGAASWLLARREPVTARAPEPVSVENDKFRGAMPAAALSPFLKILLLAGFALSGLTSFAYEVLWVRSLIFVVGNSTYAFTIMLTTFLVGVALGGYVVRYFVDRLKNPLGFFAWVQVAIGLSAAAAMPLLNWFLDLELTRAWILAADSGLGSLMTIYLMASFVVMFIPTLLIGMTFPLVGKILVRDLQHSGAEVGKVYAINTVGNIAGALLPAFLLIPLLGIHRGILCIAAVNVGIGLLIFAYGRGRTFRFRHLAPLASIFLIGLAATVPKAPQFPSNSQEAGDSVLFYHEGIAATTKVFQKPTGHKHMSVDGIQIGGSNPELDYKQQWLAHLPKLLLDDYQTEVSVGLGSGILVGESARHEGLEKIICLEIAPSVVEGAAYFQEENYGVLDSPKVEIVLNDAVNYLLTSRNRYDIISTDGKTKPEYGVNGIFFSKEYYALMRDHLTPGGVAIQWIPIHYPPEIFKIVLNTFCQTFPHALIWYAESNCFLVGSLQEITPDPVAIERKLADPELPYDGLRKFGMTSAKSVLAQLVCAEDAVLEVLSGGTALPINTMEKPIIEFHEMEDFLVPEAQRKLQNLDLLRSIRAKGRVGQFIERMPEDVQTAYEAEGQYLIGQRLVLAGAKRAELEAHFRRALDLDPDNLHLRHHIYGHYLETGITLIDAGKWERADIYLRRAIEIWPHDPVARYRMGFVHMKRHRGEAALLEYEASLALNPRQLNLRHSLAETYVLSKMPDDAERHYSMLVDAHPDDAKALRGLAEVSIQQQNYEEALAYGRRAFELAPEDPKTIDSYAWALFQSGELAVARELVDKAGNYHRDSKSMQERREAILQE